MADRFGASANTYGDTLTSTGLVGVDFGFTAGQVVVENLGAGSAYISLVSTNAASTVAGEAFPLSSGATVSLLKSPTRYMSIAATSTAGSVKVGAFA